MIGGSCLLRKQVWDDFERIFGLVSSLFQIKFNFQSWKWPWKWYPPIFELPQHSNDKSGAIKLRNSNIKFQWNDLGHWQQQLTREPAFLIKQQNRKSKKITFSLRTKYRILYSTSFPLGSALHHSIKTKWQFIKHFRQNKFYLLLQFSYFMWAI